MAPSTALPVPFPVRGPRIRDLRHRSAPPVAAERLRDERVAEQRVERREEEVRAAPADRVERELDRRPPACRSAIARERRRVDRRVFVAATVTSPDVAVTGSRDRAQSPELRTRFVAMTPPSASDWPLPVERRAACRLGRHVGAGDDRRGLEGPTVTLPADASGSRSRGDVALTSLSTITAPTAIESEFVKLTPCGTRFVLAHRLPEARGRCSPALVRSRRSPRPSTRRPRPSSHRRSPGRRGSGPGRRA